MESLKTSIKNLTQTNKPYASDHKPNSIELKIWTGPALNQDNELFQCKGYYIEQHITYACRVDAWDALISKKYKFSKHDIDNILEIVKPYSVDNYFNELNSRWSKSDPKATKKESRILNRSDQRLLELLAFFKREVVICAMDPTSGHGGDKTVFGGRPDPIFNYVKVFVRSSGGLDCKNAIFVPSPSYPREYIRAVPKSSGIKSYKYNLDLQMPSDRHLGNIKTRITNTNNQMNVLYDPQCGAEFYDVGANGDEWFEGIKSSISNGIYEVWADDIGAGPLVKRTREFVSEAAARYYKDIDPTNERYRGYRVNPLANVLPSNAITPVQIYLDDFLGDPTAYVGIIAVLIAIASFDEIGSKEDFNYKYIDKGVFDYNKVYNAFDGNEVR